MFVCPIGASPLYPYTGYHESHGRLFTHAVYATRHLRLKRLNHMFVKVDPVTISLPRVNNCGPIVSHLDRIVSTITSTSVRRYAIFERKFD